MTLRTHTKYMFQKQQMEQEEKRRIEMSRSSPASSLYGSDIQTSLHSHHSVNSYVQGLLLSYAYVTLECVIIFRGC